MTASNSSVARSIRSGSPAGPTDASASLTATPARGLLSPQSRGDGTEDVR